MAFFWNQSQMAFNTWEDTETFYWKYNPTQGCFLRGQLIRLNPIKYVALLVACVAGVWKGRERRFWARGKRDPRVSLAPKTPFPFPFKRLPRRLHFSKVRKFSCRVLDFRYIFLIFILRQNKLVCAQRVSKKTTRFVPLRVHFLEMRRIGSWNTLPRRRSGFFSSSSYFLHDKCLYL